MTGTLLFILSLKPRHIGFKSIVRLLDEYRSSTTHRNILHRRRRGHTRSTFHNQSVNTRKERKENLPHLQSNTLPRKHKCTQIRTYKDANNEITVVIHGEQHDEIRDCECDHV